MKRLRLLTFVCAWLLAPLPALAQDAPPSPPPATAPPADPATARARERKAEGDRAMDALRFADAHAAYADVFAITRDAALLYNMGRALQALNRHPEALTNLEAFQAVASPALKARVPRLGELIAELRGRVATLQVSCNVPGARVLVRRTVMGKLPLEAPLRLSAGQAEIEIEADGHFPHRATIDLPGGGEAKIDAKLFSKTTTGLLSVRASAAGSVVLVDDNKAGLAPVEINVASGTHRIRIKHPDFRDYETTTVVAAGTRKDLDVKLLPPLIVSRWWFWTSIAVAGAAAGVIGYVATTERSPSRGDIAPGQIRAPSAFSGGATLLSF